MHHHVMLSFGAFRVASTVTGLGVVAAQDSETLAKPRADAA